jgi:hypothetical protein
VHTKFFSFAMSLFDWSINFLLKKDKILAPPKLKIEKSPLVTFIICKNIVELRLWDKRPMKKIKSLRCYSIT